MEEGKKDNELLAKYRQLRADRPGLKIQLSSYTIGKPHDPYGVDVVTIQDGVRHLAYYSDALGENRMSFWNDDLLEKMQQIVTTNMEELKTWKEPLNKMAVEWFGMEPDDLVYAYYMDRYVDQEN